MDIGPGDTVECVDATGEYGAFLMEGALYMVREVRPDGQQTACLHDDCGQRGLKIGGFPIDDFLCPNRFRPIRDERTGETIKSSRKVDA